jgi:hypothetical protein
MSHPLLRFAALAWGVVSLLLALLAWVDISMLGFPDGHITPYQTQTRTLRSVLAAACAMQGLLFVVAAARGRTPARPLALFAALAAFAVVAPMLVVPRCAAIGACTRAYEAIMRMPMDDGAGG